MLDLEHLDFVAHSWPVKTAVSHTRDMRAIQGPDRGGRQLHLVCWHPGAGGLHCGQTVHVLALGRRFHRTDVDGILQGIKLHITQCHREAINDETGTPQGQ
jgi:hypothetical protein